MKERGILFTPENHRLILEGRKWQTRRVWKKQPYVSLSNPPNFKDTAAGDLFICQDLFPTTDQRGYVIEECESIGTYHAMGAKNFIEKHGPKAYGVPGDRLYIKEGVIIHVSIPQLVGYYMNGCRVTEPWEKRLTAMFMPKWAARTWLEITDVRVERLQDIIEEDAIAEGVESPDTEREDHDWKICPQCGGTRLYEYQSMSGACPDTDCTKCDTNVKRYQHLWDSINKKKHPWSQNPFVWAIGFQLIK